MAVVLIFGVFYPIITLLVWALGAYQIASNKHKHVTGYNKDRIDGDWVFGRSLLTFFAGIFWPVALGLWFAWNKGEEVARVQIVREKEMLALDSRSDHISAAEVIDGLQPRKRLADSTERVWG